MLKQVRTFLDALLGRPLAEEDEEAHKVGVWQGIPMLGLDALASSSYGPEAALTLLLPLGAAGLIYLRPIILVILAILAILYFSYRQTIAAYPTGGGSYTVAKENLGTRWGLLAAAALMLDYILNVAVAISAGVAALVSVFPSFYSHTLALCLGVLLLIAVVNLRGVRESGVAWSLPTYAFVASLGSVLIIGGYRTLTSGGHPTPAVAPLPLPEPTSTVSLWILLRAFASGCTAMTGVEAVSNGVSAFAEPACKGAQRTLTAIVVILGTLLAGITFLTHAYGIGARLQEQPQYQSVISQLVAAVVGRNWLYYVTLGSVLCVLSLSANTSFAGFPRLCRLIAEDDFLPHGFANKGRRLVYSYGIVILTVFAGLLLIVFRGITDRLIPLFAVGAFLAFTLSQVGMVVHWRRKPGRGSIGSLAVNAIGALATGTALVVVLVAKFVEGAWITALLIPLLLALFYRVNWHYAHVRQETECKHPLDTEDLQPPLVIVLVAEWDAISEKALRFGLRLSPNLLALHICTGDDDEHQFRREWTGYVEQPLRAAGKQEPQLLVVRSPYRHLITPVIRQLRRLEREHPTRQLAVIIPELVETRWWQYLLHNQRAAMLKAALLFWGDRRIAVINVPWYLGTPPVSNR